MNNIWFLLSFKSFCTGNILCRTVRTPLNITILSLSSSRDNITTRYLKQADERIRDVKKTEMVHKKQRLYNRLMSHDTVSSTLLSTLLMQETLPAWFHISFSLLQPGLVPAPSGLAHGWAPRARGVPLTRSHPRPLPARSQG